MELDSGISVTAVTTPALFTGPPDTPAQVVRVRIRRERPAGPLYVTVDGAGVSTPHPRIVRADTAEDHEAHEAQEGHEPQGVLQGAAGAEGALRLRIPADVPGAVPAPLAGPDRALGAAEIVLPDAGTPDGLRELVVALGRYGVTATPTRPAGPRWGDPAVDSSLPDFRIALARAVAASGRLDAAGAPAGEAAHDVPYEAAHDVPYEAAHEVPYEVPYARRTVGILVRGTPGFAVDTAGRLHGTLMRSCTGRPAGEWMDPPRRTAPDGSSFQLQHWTHVFEHALVAGNGDWREVDRARRGREFNEPLTAVTAAPTGGPQPPARSLLAVQPADRVLIETVKRGEEGGLAVRLRETHGRPAAPEVHWPTRPAAEADLLDRPRGPFGAGLGGAATTTLLLRTPSGMPLRHGEREPHQPVFSRCWLHNTGTAPLGDAPYTVTCDGAPVRRDGDARLPRRCGRPRRAGGPRPRRLAHLLDPARGGPGARRAPADPAERGARRRSRAR
ncbi:hypothetical protein [Streptomyces sp. NPDC059979]|uniref:hypothetical protein n=1 Tax=Streptomyces sp. NPDC059979 TaxID=3347021 RepID=UPI0036762588